MEYVTRRYKKLGNYESGKAYTWTEVSTEKKEKKICNSREQREGNNHEQGTTLESRHRTTTKNIVNKCYQNIV